MLRFVQLSWPRPVPSLRCVSAFAVASAVVATAAVPQANSNPAVTLPPPKPDARVQVVASCPTISGEQLTNAQGQQMAAMSDLLLPSLAAVQTYAKPELGQSNGTRAITDDLANPSSKFGIIGMGGPWNARVVFLQAVGTPTELQAHANALTLLVPRPDRVVVCSVAISEQRRNEITDALWSRQRSNRDPQFYSADSFERPDGRVVVHLRSDAEALARELQQTYGTDIVTTLGNFSWPDPANPGPGPLFASTCGSVPESVGPKLRWSLPTSIRVAAGASFDVKAQVRTVSKTDVQITAFRAVLTNPGSRKIVATNAQGLFYTQQVRFARPSFSSVGARGGTDSCDASTGWKLPPGKYTAYIVSVDRLPSGHTFTSPPIPVTVTS
jgi:hypothetical protein